MRYRRKHFTHLKALHQGNAFFNKTFTSSRDSLLRSRAMGERSLGRKMHLDLNPRTSHQPLWVVGMSANPPRPVCKASRSGCGGHVRAAPATLTDTLESTVVNPNSLMLSFLSPSHTFFFFFLWLYLLVCSVLELDFSKHHSVMFLCCLSRSVFWETGTKLSLTQGFRKTWKVGGLSRTRTNIASWAGGWLTQEKMGTAHGRGKKIKAGRDSFLNRLGTEARTWTTPRSQIRKSLVKCTFKLRGRDS